MDRKKLALIHIIKKELKLTDAEYRDILYEAAGVRSAKELTEATFKKLMNYFVRSRHYRLNSYGLTIKQKVFIQYLAHELGWDAGHFKNFINKFYHKFRVEWLTKKEASKVIESLKSIRDHRKNNFISKNNVN